MKKILLGIICCCLWGGIQAQEKGVLFQKLPFKEARQKAGEEKKLVFVDFYTEWCGPCKQMSREVFPQQQVGDYFNDRFICLKIDAEKGEGKELARQYQVQGYPTFMVLDSEGTVVYRTSGARPADEFIEKISKGIDPEWSPAGLAKRYEKGERTPELIRDYAILKMENGKGEEGRKILQEYFDALPVRKRVKPENLFLYEEFALGREFLFDHKEALVKNNGCRKIDSLMCRWLRFDLIPFICLRSPEPVSVEGLQQVKERIARAALSDEHYFDPLLAIAEMRMTGDNKKYLERCKEKFPLLDDKDRFSILLNFSELRNESPEVKIMAATLIGEYLNIVEGINQRILKTQMLELEGKKEYNLRAELEGAENGKLLVMSFSKGRFRQDTFAFAQGKIELDLAGTDTLDMTLCIMGEGLGARSASSAPFYPRFSLLMVPGEFAVLKVKVASGKIPVVEWVRGGEVSHDFVRLTYEQAAPDELAYRQLSMDNIIRAGDIREYKTEFDAYMKADKQKVMNFVRNNPESFITLRNLMEHYNWFDENEIEAIYHRFPEDMKKTSLARALKHKLDAGKDYRTGTQAADFVKKDLKGKIVTLNGLHGKYVLLDFWGSWCGPCRASHPHLKELYRKYHSQIEFIHIASEGGKTLEASKASWKKAVEEDGLTWTQILNDEGQEKYDLVALYHITAFPTKILIDPEGRIVARMVGGSDDPEELFRQLLEK